MTPALVTLSAATAIAYGGWYCYRAPSPLKTVVKTLPVGMLALVAWLQGGPGWLVAGLVFSTLGDLFLARKGEANFLAGLINFAAAHLAYIILFVGFATSNPGLLPLLALAAFALPTEYWLTPHTGNLRWPVRVYVTLITAMGIMAWALPGGLYLALWGAMAFIASDTLLAIQMFRMPSAHRLQVPVSMALWALYYGAQALICAAFIT